MKKGGNEEKRQGDDNFIHFDININSYKENDGTLYILS